MSTSLRVEDYQTLSDIAHALQRPDMYIGSTQKVPRQSFCLINDNGKDRIKFLNITHPEGEEQLFLEILGNAGDNVWRSRDEFRIDPLRIEVTMTQTSITVKNYGANIPVDQDASGWIPNRIFSNFRTGSNFDDQKKRMYIGKNGMGSKLCNVYSLVFSIECADPERHLLYKETWLNNMTSSSFSVEPYTGIGYTQVNYSLDFARFFSTGFDEEAFQLYTARCAEVAYTCQIPVIFNGREFAFKTIFEYANMFFPINRSNAISFTDSNGTYEICLVDTPNEAVCVSFVNGIITRSGGVHVDAAYSVVTKKIIDLLGKIVEGVTLTKRDLVGHVSIFLNCRLDKPTFTGQSKEILKSPTPKIQIPDEVLKGVRKWNLVQHIYNLIEQKQKAKLKKTDGKRTKRINNERVTDANFAGGEHRSKATAILCEGDSAEAYTTVWIARVPNRQGRNYFGTLPLHGKILNVLNADFLQILNNQDIKNIKEMLGLKDEEAYYNVNALSNLRYANVLIIADPDDDGKHILGLILLYFLSKHPGLVYHGRIKFLRVPILRINEKGVHRSFYTYASYNEWRASVNNPDDYKPDYFKGLGTSEKKHVAEDYANPKVVTFQLDPSTTPRILMAFDNTRAEERKVWLSNWFNNVVEENLEPYEILPISKFIDHEFITYSTESLDRSIPDYLDGLKESQRKAFYAALKKLHNKKDSDKIKTGEIAHHAAEITNYKHGPKCLSDAITKMSQDFVGSNNLSYFVARGMMGTRNKNGKDAANERYTAVSLPWWISHIYRKEDEGLLQRVIDEGKPREVRRYFPILPMHPINGQSGIGTGWSTSIPSHNPLDIAFWYQQRLTINLGQVVALPQLRPWYKGFRGTVTLDKNGFTTEGSFKAEFTKIIVDELPVGISYQDYNKKLLAMEEAGVIEKFENMSDDNPYFEIYGFKDGNPSLKKLHLITRGSYNNMTVLIDGPRGYIPKTYNSLVQLLEDFFQARLIKYQERKAYHLKEIQQKITDLTERLRFIQAVNNGDIEIRKRSKKDVLADMMKYNFAKALYTSVKTSEYCEDTIIEIQEEIQKLLQEWELLSNTPTEKIWYNEIEDFINAYCKHEKVPRSTYESCNSVIPSETLVSLMSQVSLTTESK